jgi:DNA-binding MarR family transcriptional regulator
MDSIEPLEPLTQEYRLWRLLSYTERLISAANSKALRRIGLSHDTSAILAAVWRLHNNAMPIEIARYGLRKPQTITSSIDKMVKKGLLIKSRDENKKNTFRVSLTEKGKLAYQKATSLTMYKRIMSTLSEEQRKQLEECLEELKKSTQKYLKTFPLDINGER